jgi:magnesium-transporting ATPase (P-type)
MREPPRARTQNIVTRAMFARAWLFLGIVACQVGTGFAARTDRVTLRTLGVFSNKLLLWGIAFELTFVAALIYLPPLQTVFGTASLPADLVLLTVPFPFIVWGADELRRMLARPVVDQNSRW